MSKSITCQYCNSEFSPRGFPSHIRHSHGISADEYVKKHGEFRTSKKNTTPNRDTSTVECQICSNTYSSVGMATHLKHAHGLTTDEYVERYGEFRKKYLNRSDGNLTCLMCNQDLHSERALTYHLKQEHGGITKKEYAVQYVHHGEHPTCKCGCGEETSFTNNHPYFREYVSGHNSKGENNPMYGKTHTKATKEKMLRAKYESLVKRLDENMITANFSFDEYCGLENTRPHTKYKMTCQDCNSSFEMGIRRSRIPTCPNCKTSRSKGERELSRFLESLGVQFEENNRTVLKRNRELDFFIPECNLAIEYNGLYWHGEIGGGKGRNYHLNKTEECEEKGIQLLHVFEDEWINRKDVVKSVIKAKCGLISSILYARSCDIKFDVSKQDKKDFFDENHIMGNGHSNTAYALTTGNGEDVVVCMASFGSIRFSSESGKELVRLATKKDTIVVGGFSRLLSHYIKNENPSKIISYVDRRYSSKKLSNSYEKVGFEYEKTSPPGYWYFNSNDKRYHRSNFTKQNVLNAFKDADPDKTEFENMVEMGYDRIWDCGQLKYTQTPKGENP